MTSPHRIIFKTGGCRELQFIRRDATEEGWASVAGKGLKRFVKMKYNAVIRLDRDGYWHSITFENEQDITLFLLRV